MLNYCLLLGCATGWSFLPLQAIAIFVSEVDVDARFLCREISFYC